MSIPARLSNKLHEKLGEQAAEDLVNWLDDERAARQAVLVEMRALFAKQTEDLVAKIHAVDLRVSAVEVKLAEVRADLIKWSFVFWVGAVVAIAMLAGVLKR